MAQFRQKANEDCQLRALRFGVDGHIFLCVSPIEGVMRFGREGKLHSTNVDPLRFSTQLMR